MGENRDRLSDLPDPILSNILSQLKARQVVQTCVLSKRWSKFWTSVPYLDFDPSEFGNEVNSDGNLERFENFVTMFLHLRDDAVNIDTFRIEYKFYNNSNYDSFTQWILYALKHNPRKLEIIHTGINDLDLPNCFFVCESLEEARIELRNYSKNIPDKIFLPNLRKLHSVRTYIEGDIMEKILSGCPTLESLELQNCTFNIKDEISFRTVKRLSISGSWLNALNVNIYGPSLEYLNYDITGRNFKVILKDMHKVTKAKISTYDECYGCELLSSLSSVKVLQLDSWVFETMLERELSTCPTFHNLNKLTLGTSDADWNLCWLASFLKHCPYLEELTLVHIEYRRWKMNAQSREENERKLNEIERFGCNGLKSVIITYA